jgi:hypothetical protein
MFSGLSPFPSTILSLVWSAVPHHRIHPSVLLLHLSPCASPNPCPMYAVSLFLSRTSKRLSPAFQYTSPCDDFIYSLILYHPSVPYLPYFLSLVCSSDPVPSPIYPSVPSCTISHLSSSVPRISQWESRKCFKYSLRLFDGLQNRFKSGHALETPTRSGIFTRSSDKSTFPYVPRAKTHETPISIFALPLRDVTFSISHASSYLYIIPFRGDTALKQSTVTTSFRVLSCVRTGLPPKNLPVTQSRTSH